MEYKYRAVRAKQTSTGNWLVLFAAPAMEIDAWSGVPRKTQLGNHETTGFQRERSKTRLKSLKEFYSNHKNTIQNPLLLATRKTSQGAVAFEPDPTCASDVNAQVGQVTIQAHPLEKLSLVELLKLVRVDLESRVPGLVELPVSPSVITELKLRAQLMTEDEVNTATDNEDEEEETESNGESSAEGDEDNDTGEQEEIAQAVLQESHVLDFWQDIVARIDILEELKEFNEDQFLGIRKVDLYDFLRPIVVVDGQHRLWGALETAKDEVRKDYLAEIEEAVASGKDPEQVQIDMLQKVCRRLPVSLLMADDPAEHVFQFVVVNQKATPIGKALLGTIVSTSLSNDELDRVANRLTKAGIPLENSRVVSYLERQSSSPFCGRVERGLASDDKDLLPWTVLVSLVSIFRKLKDGKLYHGKNDYADKWRRDFLQGSPIVASWEEKGFKSPLDYWQSPDGPWRDVFKEFWAAVRSKLASEDPTDSNYWGNPRTSNLFNKVSLTILAADFFQYLTEKDIFLENAGSVADLVSDWLKGVKAKYFGRDWKLSGVKKDSTGIRKKWSRTWFEYRKDPQLLPQVGQFRVPDVG